MIKSTLTLLIMLMLGCTKQSSIAVALPPADHSLCAKINNISMLEVQIEQYKFKRDNPNDSMTVRIRRDFPNETNNFYSSIVEKLQKEYAEILSSNNLKPNFCFIHKKSMQKQEIDFFSKKFFHYDRNRYYKDFLCDFPNSDEPARRYPYDCGFGLTEDPKSITKFICQDCNIYRNRWLQDKSNKSPPEIPPYPSKKP